MEKSGATALSTPTLTSIARAAPTPTGNKRSAFFAVFGIFFLTLFLAGQAVGTMAEERSNKVVEVLAAAVPLEAVFFGKLIGMFGSALLFIGFWGTLASQIDVLVPGAARRRLPRHRPGGRHAGLLAAVRRLFRHGLYAAGRGVHGRRRSGEHPARAAIIVAADHHPADHHLRPVGPGSVQARQLAGDRGGGFSVQLALCDGRARGEPAGHLAAPRRSPGNCCGSRSSSPLPPAPSAAACCNRAAARSTGRGWSGAELLPSPSGRGEHETVPPPLTTISPIKLQITIDMSVS